MINCKYLVKKLKNIFNWMKKFIIKFLPLNEDIYIKLLKSMRCGNSLYIADLKRNNDLLEN